MAHSAKIAWYSSHLQEVDNETITWYMSIDIRAYMHCMLVNGVFSRSRNSRFVEPIFIFIYLCIQSQSRSAIPN